MGQFVDESAGFVSGLGMDPATAKMVSDCMKSSECTDNAIKIGNYAWGKAVASRDAIIRTAERTIGAITGSSRDAKRRRNKGKAQAKGIWYRKALGPLYDQCFGVSDWFQNTRIPPQANPKRANPQACCDLITHYREAADKGWTATVGKKYGPYSLRIEGGRNIGNRINPQEFMDVNYGGSQGYPRSDSDEWYVSNACFGPKVGSRFCLQYDRKGIGCGARDQRPFCKNRDEEVMAMTTGFCRIRPSAKPKPPPSQAAITKAFTIKARNNEERRKANIEANKARLDSERNKNLLIAGSVGIVVLGAAGFIYFKRRKR